VNTKFLLSLSLYNHTHTHTHTHTHAHTNTYTHFQCKQQKLYPIFSIRMFVIKAVSLFALQTKTFPLLISLSLSSNLSFSLSLSHYLSLFLTIYLSACEFIPWRRPSFPSSIPPKRFVTLSFLPSGVNFTNILQAAFTRLDPESVKNTVLSFLSFYSSGICARKSCT